MQDTQPKPLNIKAMVILLTAFLPWSIVIVLERRLSKEQFPGPTRPVEIN